MTLEAKQALGRVIRAHRQRHNWTQEHLADVAEVNTRTIQRAEAGDGVSPDALSAIATAFDVDGRDLLRQAANAAAPSPEKRITLRHVTSSVELPKLLSPAALQWRSLEICPPDEHEFNAALEDYFIELLDALEDETATESTQKVQVQSATEILATCRNMGFGLFAGTYSEKIQTTAGMRTKKTLLIIAAPLKDPRITRTGKGLQLDVIRDARRLLSGRIFGPHTFYDWIKDQLMSKSNGEENVKNALRRMQRP